jgi:hypothetical protein
MLDTVDSSQSWSSRRRRRATFGPSVRWALTLMSILMIVSASTATAGVGWCRSDPVIMVNGNISDIFVSAPLDALLVVTGPTQIVVTTPPDVDAVLIASTLGFGHGEVVAFEQSRSLKVSDEGTELRIQVFVPATDDQLPVLVEFSPRLIDILSPITSEGTANDWISFRVVV